MTEQPSEVAGRAYPDVLAEQTARQQAQTTEGLEGRTVEDLREEAKARGIVGYSRMNRAELLGALTDADAAAEGNRETAAEETTQE